MTRDVTAGAWYGELLPSGEWCALVPHSHVATHLGLISLPQGEPFGPRYVRCTNVNGFRFAGQADSLNPACWEWDTASVGWLPYGPPCVGVSPVIYDRDGVLHRSDGSVGSQGYRYVTPENVIVSGDATYRLFIDYPAPADSIFEYTLLDGFAIGQAAYDGGGVQVWDGQTLRTMELGDCTFVRANQSGDVVAIAFKTPAGVVRITATVAELMALPPVATDDGGDDGDVDPEDPDEPDEPDDGGEPEPEPTPPTQLGDLMQMSHFDPSKVYPYKQLKPSSRKGCVNVILTDGSVLSAQGDTRPAGTDGPWEQGVVSGNAVQLKDNKEYYTWLIMPAGDLP